MTIAIDAPRKRAYMRPVRKDAHEAGGSLADIVAPLAQKGRISRRAMWAAHMLIADLQADAGSSGNIAACYAERVQSSLVHHGHMSGWTAAGDRVQSVLNLLDASQRQLLDYLIRNREYDRRGLADFGRARAAYASDEANSAYTVGRIDGLLESIAALYSKYGGPAPA